MGEKKMTTFALAGNPNSGKTSLFNMLTGSRHHVGNWPGVTVEKVFGYLKNDHNSLIVDLPGIYSLSPLSEEEKVATHYMIEEKFDVLLNIVDAANLERNLYFTLQLLEYGKPLIVALNMADILRKKGIELDLKRFSEVLGVKVVEIIAKNGVGEEELLKLMQTKQKITNFQLDYGRDLELVLSKLTEIIKKKKELENYQARWLAIQFLEDNQVINDLMQKMNIYNELKEIQRNFESANNRSTSELIKKRRYQWIEEFMAKVVIKENKEKGRNWTEKIDQVITHPWLAIPIFFFMMYLIFQITFAWIGAPLQDILDQFISGTVATLVNSGLSAIDSPDWIISLAVDGIIAGVGGVLVFVPQIIVLFFLISFLEDSGYMARAAFIMDRFMAKIGLNGKAFIPMIIGFGCNVPAVMTTRTIENPKQRLVTILMLPFMSCSARLPVYALLAGIFFPKSQGIVIFSLYLIGIVMALLVGLILKNILLTNEDSSFVLELPDYHLPSWKNLALHTWDKGKGFVRKAGTLIFSMSVLIWFLSNFSWQGITSIENSFFAQVGSFLAPIFYPLGFGSWQAVVSILSGVMAKEVVVSSMMVIFGAVNSGADIATILPAYFTPLSAYSFMIFVLLYIPCIPTVLVMQKETGSWKWVWIAISYSLGIAWLLSMLIYQVGSIFI